MSVLFTMKRICLALFCSLLSFSLSGEVKLPSILADNMVLQRQSEINLWGQAHPKSKITIKTSWNNKRYETLTNAEGKWLAKVSTPEAGGPYEISFDDGDELILKNILIGDVWICGGQSNMEMPVYGFFNQPVDNSIKAVIESEKLPIRFVTLRRNPQNEPQEDCPNGGWLTTSHENTPQISATAYFFAKQLTETTGIPIGLISSNWGASRIEAWMSPQAVAKVDGASPEKYVESKSVQEQPYKLYNGMIAPITNFTAKGFIWSHGASNRNEWYLYSDLQVELIKQWRTKWGNNEMPFIIIQKTYFEFQGEKQPVHVLLMEGQLKATQKLSNVYMCAVSDIYDEHYIHQPQKDVIGERTAYVALKHCYGRSALQVDPPLMHNVIYEGVKAIVSFENATLGLYPAHEAILGFELAGEDRIFYPAEARIVTIYPEQSSFPKEKERFQWFFDLHDRYQEAVVEITSPQVAKPVAVRYGFKNLTRTNLTNTFGIPVYPFRTDNWIERKPAY